MLLPIFGTLTKKKVGVTVLPPFTRFLGDLDPWLNDPDMAEIYLSTPSAMAALDHHGERRPISLNWSTDDVTEFLSELSWESKTRLDPFRPFAGGVIPSKPWRWHAIIPPMSPDGPLLVLRRLNFDAIHLDQFIFENFLPGDFLKWIEAGISIVFYGATGSGKTTLLVAIMRKFFMETRVGIAECLSEIPLTSERWFRLIEVSQDTGGRGGIDFSRVVAEMMRLSPQLLVMGEIRGREAAMLSDFARTGHGGVMTTMHAGTITDARTRLSQLAKAPLTAMPPISGIRVWRDDQGIGHAYMDQLN
jgi:pilus assembly protein CpaF